MKAYLAEVVSGMYEERVDLQKENIDAAKAW